MANSKMRNALSVLRKGQIAVPILLLCVLAMVILPLSPLMLDILFTFNIVLAVIVLLVAVNMQRPLDFAIFPTLLLITTLMRLTLNVASTVARRFFLHQNAINFALPEGAKKTHSAQCKNERKECLLMLLLSRITFVESRQADPIFESYITM